jgi:hypothetical protein
MLSIIYAESQYAECHYALWRIAECRYAGCHVSVFGTTQVVLCAEFATHQLAKQFLLVGKPTCERT